VTVLDRIVADHTFVADHAGVPEPEGDRLAPLHGHTRRLERVVHHGDVDGAGAGGRGSGGLVPAAAGEQHGEREWDEKGANESHGEFLSCLGARQSARSIWCVGFDRSGEREGQTGNGRIEGERRADEASHRER